MINITEILINAPVGIRLYSPICGVCELDQINQDGLITVKKLDTSEYHYLDKFGRLSENGECLLFPSKEHRLWDSWQYVIMEYCVGKVFTDGMWMFLVESGGTIRPYDMVTKKISSQSENLYDYLIEEFRFATPDETNEFFSAMRKQGYYFDRTNKVRNGKEDVNTSCIEDEAVDTIKDACKEYDKSQLKPFDKVLMRYGETNEWSCGFYSHYSFMSRAYCTTDGFFTQCVPYNDDTKHLLGTIQSYEGPYKTW